MANRPFDGYPTSFGSTRASIFPHSGPASYTQITAVSGTVPVTGGDTVSGPEAGLKYFEKIDGGYSDDGCWQVVAIPVTKSALVGGPSTTMKLKWVAQVTATIGGQAQTAGSEAVAATNLSAVTVRLMAFGPK